MSRPKLVRPTLAIAINTYREAVRSKVLYSILFFGILVIASAALFGEVSAGQHERLVMDLGLYAIRLFGNVMAVFLGVSFVNKEIERKSIYNIVSKPIWRSQYFIGKFGGIALTLLLQLLFMSIVMVAVATAWIGEFPGNLLVAIGLIAIEVLIVATVALFFSSFSTPYVSGFLALGVMVAGGSLKLLQRFTSSVELPVLEVLLDLADRVLPALYLFDRSREVTYGIPISFELVFHASVYGLCYAAVMLMLGAFLFSRRDFA